MSDVYSILIFSFMDYMEQRAEREREKEAQRQASRGNDVKREVGKWGSVLVWGLLIVLLVVGLVWLVLRSGPDPIGETFALQGREHIPVGAEHPAYNSNPPTSGSHYASAAEWGVYDRALSDEQLIHNLEHGGIWISYRPGLIESAVVELRAFAKEHPKSVIVTEREQNDSMVSVAAWRMLLKLDSVDMDQVKQFYKANKNNSPEPLAGK